MQIGNTTVWPGLISMCHFDGLCGGKFAEEMKRRKMNRSIVDPVVSSP